ncbi:hypothetical protein [Clostridium oryzae]|uniref:Uncharacterized protein n=1 Tax=Clostridium oryzae TaxID=1450648 RepID=A0A1V4I6W4_9CLOT|nr:hypothetical protein [Clostridium oryzae]OPJ55345.1 hypothetical protein CLORY_44370 [Clostridium oryzae]
MMKATNEYSVRNGKNSRVQLGNNDGNCDHNIIIILLIVAAVCYCGGPDNILPVSQPIRHGRRRRRSRSRNSFRSILYLIFLALLLGGNSNGRNANTNIIHVDSPRLNDEEVLDL